VAAVSGPTNQVQSLTVAREDLHPATETLAAMGAPLVLTEARTAAARSPNTSSLEGSGWRLTVDPRTGGLSELVEERSGRDWVGVGREFGFGQLVHEAVVHPLGRQATHNIARFVALGTASEFALEHLGNHKVFEHSTLEFADEPRLVRGPVFDALELSGRSDQLGEATVAWRSYHALPLVELVIDWNKRYFEGTEAAYVPFGFAAEGARLELETAGGFFQPGSFESGGQLPGTVSSYYTVQRAGLISVPSGERLLWLPVDAPLVMTQALDYNRWEATVPYAWNGFLASMPVNHYWHTNFATSQRGRLRLRYRFFAPTGDVELSIRRANPLEALGWR
jgi:hypothetical protein